MIHKLYIRNIPIVHLVYKVRILHTQERTRWSHLADCTGTRKMFQFIVMLSEEKIIHSNTRYRRQTNLYFLVLLGIMGKNLGTPKRPSIMALWYRGV